MFSWCVPIIAVNPMVEAVESPGYPDPVSKVKDWRSLSVVTIFSIFKAQCPILKRIDSIFSLGDKLICALKYNISFCLMSKSILNENIL